MTFKVNKDEITNKKNVTKRFGQFLSSIATALLQSLDNIKDFAWNKLKNLPIWTTQKLSFHLDTSSEICKCLKKLWRKKAHNIDKLPQNLLQDVGNKISKPIDFINKPLLLVQFQTSGKNQKLHHFINQIQNQTSAITVQYLFYHVFLKC